MPINDNILNDFFLFYEPPQSRRNREITALSLKAFSPAKKQKTP